MCFEWNTRKPVLLLAAIASVSVVALAWTSGTPSRVCCYPLKNACINSLRQLEGAKVTWAVENQIANLSVIPRMDQLCGATNYIRDVPVCPMGGAYTIGRIRDKPQCSLHGHTL